MTIQEKIDIQKVIEAEIATVEVQRTDLFEKIRPLQDEVFELNTRLSDLNDRLSVLLLEAGKLDSIEYLMKTYNPDRSGGEYRKALQRWGFAHDLYQSGYVVDTLQPSFSVKLSPKQDITKTSEGIRELVPFMKPRDNGRMYFGIFEHTLSLAVSYHMEVSPDCSEAWVFTHLGAHSIRHEAIGTIEEVLLYIRKHHWYDE